MIRPLPVADEQNKVAEALGEGATGHLLAPEEVIASFPGAAVLVDSLGRALAGNHSGSDLAEALAEGKESSLRAAVAIALADHAAASLECEVRDS